MKLVRLALIISLALMLLVCPLAQADDGKSEVELKVEVVQPPPVGVGGEAYPVNKVAILAPWIASIMAIIATSFVMRYQRENGS